MIDVLIILIAIAANAGISLATFAGAQFVVGNFEEVHVADPWVPVLAALQAAGAAGLLLGLLGVPGIGVAAAVGLVLFFTGAVVVHLKAGAYRSLPSPVTFLALAVVTLVVMLS
ncbi:DoxX family protein [Homoserinimonas sp. A447]